MKAMSFLVALVFCSVSTIAWALTPKEIYKKSGPAVVLILGSDDGKTGSGGTGSIITQEGKVITNAHVVLNHNNQPFKILYVFLKPDKITGDNSKDLVNRFKARVLRYSVPNELDLALLQIENPPADLATVAFGDPNKVEVGDDSIAIGCPEQGGPWTLTTGAISTVIANFNRIKGKDVFQTEASVNRGNSGGPLLNNSGNMIGINTMIARQGADGVTITGVNFALKSSVAVKWLAGQGMGLAYAKTAESKPTVVAAAEPSLPKASTAPAEPTTTTSTGESNSHSDGTGNNTANQNQADKPQSTIVVVEPIPKKEETVKLKQEGKELGQTKSKEKIVSGKPLDPNKAKPKYITKKRPYNLDELRRQQMKELEDIMDEMRGKVKRSRKSGDDMGLW
ncbi:MAG: trypsin-like peptidase domain-containing protein [Deltaproteobacteria bacterium]|nr:trypsin-like peptidase domain-containing protein [Deltaproteobacteria bacterium]